MLKQVSHTCEKRTDVRRGGLTGQHHNQHRRGNSEDQHGQERWNDFIVTQSIEEKDGRNDSERTSKGKEREMLNTIEKASSLPDKT